MKLSPVNKQIILKINKTAEKIVNGIYLPAEVQETSNEAEIYLSDHEDYKPNDVVIFRKFSGFEINYNSQNYLVIESSDVLVKLVK